MKQTKTKVDRQNRKEANGNWNTGQRNNAQNKID